MPPRKRLGQLLVELGVVDEHQVQSALGHQKQWGGKIGAILVQKGFCKEDDVIGALAKHLGMPRVKMAEAKVDPRAVKLVSKPIAEKLHVFPYEVSGSGRGEVITVAMSDPTDLSAVDQLAFHTGKRIKPMLAGDSEIVSSIQQHYGGGEEKKEPTDKLAKPPAPGTPLPRPAAATAFPKRFDPASPVPGGAPRAAPYIPPPVPQAPVKPEQQLEEIEPDEMMAPPVAPPPRPQPLDLPEDETGGSGMVGLEPIAAHSQFGDEVAGQEEVAGEGSAADVVEGLESAGVEHEGAAEAQQAPMEEIESIASQAQAPGAWEHTQESPPPQPAWESQPADVAWGASAQQGWGEAAPAQAGEVGTGWDEAAEQAPQVAPSQDWSTGQPHASGWGQEQSAAGESAWASGEQPQEAAGEQLPMDAIIGTAEAEGAPAEWGSGAEAAPQESEQAAAETPQAGPPHEAEAPDAWASSEDPLAAHAAANEATAPDRTEEFAGPAAAETAMESVAAAETEAPPEWGAPEDTGAEPAAQEAAPQEVDEAASLAVEEAPPPDEEPATAQAEEAAPQEAFAPYEAAEAAPQSEEAALQSGEGAPLYEETAPSDEAANAGEQPEDQYQESAPLFDEGAPQSEAVAAQYEESVPQYEEPPPQSGQPVYEESTPAYEEAPPRYESGEETPEYEAAQEPRYAGETAAPSAPEFGAEEGGLKLEDWVAPPAEPEPQGAGWLGEALEASTPLSPADLGTLASVGIDPNDGVGSLRLLAVLIRVLNRTQSVDPEALAAEVRESRAQGAAAAAELRGQNGEQPAAEGEEGSPVPAEPAET